MYAKANPRIKLVDFLGQVGEGVAHFGEGVAHLGKGKVRLGESVTM